LTIVIIICVILYSHNRKIENEIFFYSLSKTLAQKNAVLLLQVPWAADTHRARPKTLSGAGSNITNQPSSSNYNANTSTNNTCYQYWILIPPDAMNSDIGQMALALLADRETFLIDNPIGHPLGLQHTSDTFIANNIFTKYQMQSIEQDMSEYLTQTLLEIGEMERYNPLSFSSGLLNTVCTL
jgi:hypothetical protein